MLTVFEKLLQLKHIEVLTNCLSSFAALVYSPATTEADLVSVPRSFPSFPFLPKFYRNRAVLSDCKEKTAQQKDNWSENGVVLDVRSTHNAPSSLDFRLY